jgi:hypothetical protein
LSTAAQLKQITRSLLERDPRFVLMKRWLVIRPVGHWVHAYHLDRRMEKGIFVLESVIHPLYKPSSNMYASVGWEIFPPRSAGTASWNVTMPNVEQYLVDCLAGEASNRLTRLNTLEMFLAHLDTRGALKHEQKILTYALVGWRDAAIYMAEWLIDAYEYKLQIYPPDRKGQRRLRRLIAVFKAGQARTNRLMRTFEWICARKNGIDQWWTWKPVVT